MLPLTVNRRSDRRILQVANELAAPLYDELPMVAPLEPKDGAADGQVGVLVFETQDDELAWLAESVAAAHTGAWSDIGVLTRDNSTAEAVFDTPHHRRDPGRDRRACPGCSALPEVAEIVAMLELLHDVTANAAVLTLLTGPRWAIGPRDLRLLKERAAELAGRRGRTESATIDDQLTEIADGIDPAELPALSDALEDPGDAAYSPEALERFALLAGELRMLRAYAGEPILDVVRRIVDTTGVDIELASAVSPAAASAPGQPRPVPQGRRRVPGDRRRRHPAGTARLPDRRGRPGQRARRRDADRGRLGQAADRAPRQGPRVGLGVRGGRVRDPVPLQPVTHPVDVVALGAARAAARRRRRPAPAGRLGQARARRLPRGHPGARPARGAPARLRRVHPRRAPAVGLLLPLEPARDTVRPLGLPAVLAEPGAAGEVEVDLAGQAGEGRAEPLRRAGPLEALAGHAAIGREASAAARGGSAWCARPTRRLPTGTSTWSRLPGSATGTPSSTGCWPRPGADRSGVVDVPLPSSLSATALARLRDDPGRVRPRAGQADASPAVPGRPLRHPVPRLGRGAVRAAVPARPRRPSRVAETSASTTRTTWRS